MFMYYLNENKNIDGYLLLLPVKVLNPEVE